jgi:plastocyanin
MRSILVTSVAAVALMAAACGSSPTSVANSCGSSGASANINTPSSSNTFSPNSATITHGQTVCWQNSSSVTHTVTADNGDFDVNLPVGNIFQHTYPTAGTYTYHCKIHAAMTGTIVVN